MDAAILNLQYFYQAIDKSYNSIGRNDDCDDDDDDDDNRDDRDDDGGDDGDDSDDSDVDSNVNDYDFYSISI